MQNRTLLRSHTLQEFLGKHPLVRQHMPVQVPQVIPVDIIFHHGIGTHAQGLRHHAIQVGRFVDGCFHTVTDQLTEQEGDDTRNDDTHQQDQRVG